VAGVLVLSMLVSSFELAAGLGLQIRPFARPTIVAAQYYTAITHQDYSQAYTYVAGPASATHLEPAFIRAAELRDRVEGPVTSFTLAADLPTNPQAVTVRVHRQRGASYAVHLTVRQEGSQWKIVAFDGI
jgi:hypothetical protein